MFQHPLEADAKEEPTIIESPPKVYQVSTRSRGTGSKHGELTFEELKRTTDAVESENNPKDDAMSEQQSHRSFDFEENEEQFMDSETEVLEKDDNYRKLRDAEDEDFPSAEALKKIPTRLIENGSLIYKGKRLIRLLSIFYNMTCKICTTLRFRSIHDLFRHYRNHHPEKEASVTCCSTELTKMPKIIWHFVKHIEPDAFKCKFCDYAVSRPKFLAIHQQTHLPESEKPLECDLLVFF